MTLLARLTFNDIAGRLEEMMSAINLWDVLTVLIFSTIIGFVIYFTYLKTYRGVVYSHAFNASLVLMTVITATIILTISSNVVLSLGMVGALSIVRFRTAIKDPLDIVYLFWSISLGIIIGAKQYFFAIIATIVIALGFFIVLRLKGRKPIYLLIVRFDSDMQGDVGRVLAKVDGTIRNKNVAAGVTELTIELVLHNNNTTFVDRLAQIPGVHSAVLVNYQGDFAD